MKYVVLIEKTNNGYSPYAPDLPGCVAAADTRAEVGEMIREAIVLHLESLREHGEPIPRTADDRRLGRRSTCGIRRCLRGEQSRQYMQEDRTGCPASTPT